MSVFESIWTYLQHQLQTNDFFSGAALTGVLMSVVYQLKGLPSALYGKVKRYIFYRSTVYQTSELYTALDLYIRKCYANTYRNTEALFEHETEYNYDPDDGSLVSVFTDEDYNQRDDYQLTFTHLEDSFLIRIGWLPVLVSKGREKLENTNNARDRYLDSYTLTCVGGKRKLEKLLESASKDYVSHLQDKKESKVYVNSYSRWEPQHTAVRTWDTVFLPKEQKQFIEDSLQAFFASRETYQRMGITHKKTILLHGKPGNGKTTLGAAIASKCHRDLAYLNLSSVQEDSDLQSLFRRLPNNAILLLEDIDASFDGRNPLGNVTFSALLNCLDGIFTKDNMITLITTNHLEKLDPALIRKGRVDEIIELKDPTLESVRDYICAYYGVDVTLGTLHKKHTMAEIQDMCLNNKDVATCINKLERGV